MLGNQPPCFRRILISFSLLLTSLLCLPLYAEFHLPDSVEVRETAVYPKRLTETRIQAKGGHISLEFPYASPSIQNPEAFLLSKGYEVVGVDLVFTNIRRIFRHGVRTTVGYWNIGYERCMRWTLPCLQEIGT